MEAETIRSEEDAQKACEDFVKVTNASIEAKSKFEAYKKNAAEGGVMGMIQQIINDAKAMEVKTIRSEEYAQKAYEDFVKEINTFIEAKSKDIANNSEARSRAEIFLVEANKGQEAVMLELEQLSNYKVEHQRCDFVVDEEEKLLEAADRTSELVCSWLDVKPLLADGAR